MFSSGFFMYQECIDAIELAIGKAKEESIIRKRKSFPVERTI